MESEEKEEISTAEKEDIYVLSFLPDLFEKHLTNLRPKCIFKETTVGYYIYLEIR